MAYNPIPNVGVDRDGCFQRFLKGKQEQGVRQPDNLETMIIRVHSESIRQIAYVAFWFMCILAMLLTKQFIPPEIIENSDLMKVFGFNNICVYWDYSPSRELTALFFPLFEYSFYFYVVFDYIQTRLCFRISNPWLHRIGLWTLPVKLVLIAWFRIIFVYQVNVNPPIYDPPYPNIMARGVVGHTLAFFGMQFSLILIALQNVFYVLSTGVTYPSIGRKGTIIGCWLYLVCVVYVTFFKILTASIILSNQDQSKPPLSERWMFGFHLADRAWMVLIALMPLYFAHVAKRTEPYIKVTLELDCDLWKAESDEGTNHIT